MGNSLAIKKNMSSIQVLKTLQMLLEGNYTMAELVKKLNENERIPLFNHSVVSKYINTCRYLGIEIPKIHNKYFVSKLPFGLDLSLHDTELIDRLKTVVKTKFSERANKRFTSFLSRLSKYSNKRIVRINIGDEDKLNDEFEQAVQENRKIRLMYKTKEVLECIPAQIVNNKKTYFKIIADGEEKLVLTEKIAGIEILDKRFGMFGNNEQEVIFKLTGGLAKRYSMRENEELIDKPSGGIVISNKGENKEALFMRLLRYDSCCEIIKPLEYRDEMKQIINDTLSNYGE